MCKLEQTYNYGLLAISIDQSINATSIIILHRHKVKSGVYRFYIETISSFPISAVKLFVVINLYQLSIILFDTLVRNIN
jgi:hypothetical protein